MAGLGKLWVASRTGLYRLNATTGQVEARIAVKGAAAELAVGGGFVWLLSFRTAGAGPQRYELFKVDPRAARIVARARVNGPVGGLSFGDGALWLAATFRASASSGSIRAHFTHGCSPRTSTTNRQPTPSPPPPPRL